MSEYLAIGGGFVAVAFLVWLVWFSYRAGEAMATVDAAQLATADADVAVAKAQAMAQAQADKPVTESAVLTRLDDGTA